MLQSIRRSGRFAPQSAQGIDHGGRKGRSVGSALRTAWLMLCTLAIVFPCGGATCARRRPIAEFTPPIVFEEPPTLDQLIARLNHTQAIERLNCGTVTLSSAEASTELSGNLSWHRAARFRLQAYPGGTRMLGDALDAGSNEEAFWLSTKIPGEPHTLYYARHDQFDTQTGPRRILPVSPLWIREALGVIEFDPAWHHEGLPLRPDGKMEVRSLIPTPRGSYQRIVIVEPTRATVQQLVLIDPDGKMVASAQLSDHEFYPAVEVALPRRVDLQLQADDGPVLAFTIRIGDYIINEAMGDETLRYAMPDPAGMAKVVDLVQANASAGQMQSVPAGPSAYSAAQPDWMSNVRTVRKEEAGLLR